MRRAFLLAGFAFVMTSCANNDDAPSGNADSLSNATQNPTTGSGAAGTGGVGAGFGTGGSPTTDTGKVIRTDTSASQR